MQFCKCFPCVFSNWRIKVLSALTFFFWIVGLVLMIKIIVHMTYTPGRGLTEKNGVHCVCAALLTPLHALLVNSQAPLFDPSQLGCTPIPKQNESWVTPITTECCSLKTILSVYFLTKGPGGHSRYMCCHHQAEIHGWGYVIHAF